MPAILRIVIASTERSWRGGETQAALLAEGLRRRGHDVALMLRRGAPSAQRMIEAGFPVQAIAGRGRHPVAVARVRRFLRSFRPHVLHYNDAHALSYGGLASWGLGVPVRTASRRAMFPLAWPVRYRCFCDRVICVSRAVAAECERCGLPGEMLRVVYDGVIPPLPIESDVAQVRRELGAEDDAPLLLTVAALTEEKGHRTILAAAPRVLAEHPQTVFAFAGEGSLEVELRRAAEKLGVAQRVRFLGFRRDVADLMRAADVLVAPSHSEGLGSSLIEAMFAAKAIVAAATGGIPELIGSQAGEPPVAWMAPPHDPQALARAILDCLASSDERRLRGQLARNRANIRFTADHMVEATLAVYYEVLRAKSHAASAAHAFS